MYIQKRIDDGRTGSSKNSYALKVSSRWGVCLVVATGFLICRSSLAEDLSNKVWMRMDGQRITGNAKLEQQDRLDRAACLSAATPTGSADMFKGCMAAKGYIMVPLAEAEERLAAVVAAHAASQKLAKPKQPAKAVNDAQIVGARGS